MKIYTFNKTIKLFFVVVTFLFMLYILGRSLWNVYYHVIPPSNYLLGIISPFEMLVLAYLSITNWSIFRIRCFLTQTQICYVGVIKTTKIYLEDIVGYRITDHIEIEYKKGAIHLPNLENEYEIAE